MDLPDSTAPDKTF